MLCIICKENKEESKEHIIPQVMGNRYLITYRVCKKCNSGFGTYVDKYLVDNIIFKIERLNHNLGGKIKIFKGREIDLNTGRPFDIRNQQLRLAPIHYFDNDDLIIEGNDEDECRKYLNKFLHNYKYDDSNKKRVLNNISPKYKEINNPEFKLEIELNFREIALPIIKIAYEYAHLKLGDQYLEDEIAIRFSKELKKAIDDHGKLADNNLAKYIFFWSNNSALLNFIYNNCLECTNDDVLHTIFLFKYSNQLYCGINFFMKKEYTYGILISENSDIYNNFSSIDQIYIKHN